MLEHLDEVQRGEVQRQLGDAQGVSPEGVVHAVEGYLAALAEQAAVARSFFFGRWEEGFEHLLDLPDDVRFQIDQFIWEETEGEPLDPSTPESGRLIAAAVLRSMEERMGLG